MSTIPRPLSAESPPWRVGVAARRPPPTVLVFGAVLAVYAAIAFALLSQDVVYSGDSGVKFVQARSLLLNDYRSLAFHYPGAAFDETGEFFPFRPPFVFAVGGGMQAIFPPAGALVYAPFVGLLGLSGMRVVSVAGATLAVWATWRLSRRREDRVFPFVLALGTSLWFYAIVALEHAPALGLAMLALWLGSRPAAPRWSTVAAGVFLGLGGALRDEALLVAPGLALLVWIATRRAGAVLAAIGGLLIALASLAAVEVLWFGRPLAAHLLHAVHILRTAAGLSETPNIELPALQPMTLWQRYDTIVHYWLAGTGDDVIVAMAVAGVGLAWVAARTRVSWIGSCLVASAALGLAVWQLWTLWPAPRWVAGLFRLSPFLAFAVLPAPRPDDAPPVPRLILLAPCAVFLLIAFAGLDTDGGKSLGPRLLLPIVPLLTIAAWQSISAWARSPRRGDRWVGGVGRAAVVVSIVLQIGVMLPAYVGRNRDDSGALRALRQAPERVVVADNPFTAQLVSPLYFDKALFLADNPVMAGRLGERLHGIGVPAVLLVAREPGPRVGLEPYRLAGETRVGRMVLQQWRR